MHVVRHLVVRSAEEWNIPTRAAYLIFLAPLVISALLIPIRLNKELYRFLLDEDQIFEWATFLCFAVGTLVGLAVVHNRWQARDRLGILLYLLFTLLMFFSAGEEISWGQRIVDFDTPEDLIEINKQDEFNLHNIGESLNLFRALMIAIGLGGSTAYLLNQRLQVERLWDNADILLVPPFFLASTFLVVLAYRLFRLFIWRKSGFTITKYAESVEFWLAFGLTVFGYLVWRRLRLSRRADNVP
ncbi:MAG: hypothetical protein ACUVSU_10340 [Aggregatilineaceae bacterium]